MRNVAPAAAVYILMILALTLVGQTASAQTLGTVSNVGQPETCPLNRGFDESGAMTCYPATLTECPGNDDLNFVYGVEEPSGTPLGTIVILSGMGGTGAFPSDVTYVQDYVAARYQVVQIAWGATAPGVDWEYTNTSGGDNPPSIRVAACRPASFLNWVRNGGPYNNYQGIWGGHGGMCVQGESAGSGAAAFALTWYNAGAATASYGQGYLDKVTMKSGPVFSDIDQGCEVQNGVNSQYTSICAAGTAQTGCVGWTSQPPYHLEYVQGAQNSVNAWSGNTGPACGDNRPNVTTTYNAQWLQMSILSNPPGSQFPVLSYPNTTMSAWLCETATVPLNNSMAEGQLFYEQFTNQSQVGGSLTVNAVINCPGNPENVDQGTVAATQQEGITAIELDMTQGSQACISRH